jgi:hypothetical protein
VLADELDVEEVLDLQLADDLVGDVHQLGVVERHEVHRETRAHSLARLRMAEDDALAVRDAVDRSLAAGRELHHEQLRVVVSQQLDELLQPQRLRDPRPVRQKLFAPVSPRREDAKAARARREHGLQRHVPVRIAELACRLRGGRAAANAPPRRAAHPDPVEKRVRLRLVVRAANRLRRRHEHRHRKRLPRSRKPGQVERRLWEDGIRPLALHDRANLVGEARVRPGRDDVELVAEMPADCALLHVGSDQAQVALAVVAQRAQQRSGPGRARRGDDDGERPHERSILSSSS